ncbi:hypothetical protein [Marinobacterium rhizophilum]|uniref:hypothetical protein n=1 Tax=Marinobacterium rhizophilum TaxID=420402 RepID=UPI00035F53D7|nr:hypothetical protein [Marinobacterium rhizophilum]
MIATNVSVRDGLGCYLLTGPESAQALDGAGLPAPSQVMSARMEQGALVARTGRDEFMAILPLDRRAPEGDWCFRRFDRVLAIDGDWVGVMAQLCQFDFRTLQPGDWLMSSVAGVSCWLYRDGEVLLIGCDPGYGAYLSETIQTVVEDLGTAYLTGGAS